MTENLTKKILLDELSNRFDISSSYMDALFREATGKSPMQYLNHIRINKAKELLKENFTVSHVAQLTGFSDIYYFSRYFKKMTGVAPSYYARD